VTENCVVAPRINEAVRGAIVIDTGTVCGGGGVVLVVRSEHADVSARSSGESERDTIGGTKETCNTIR
jgi:hypothetical protein